MSPKTRSRKEEPLAVLVGIENLPERLAQRRIEALRLPARPYNSLKWRGVDSVGQLLALSERELEKSRGMGKKCIEDIHEALRLFFQSSTTSSSAACETLDDRTQSSETGDVDFPPPRPPGWPFADGEDSELKEKPKHGGSILSGDWLIPEPVCADLNAPVGRLGLSTRARTAIDRLGIATIQQLVQFSRLALLKAPNFGPKSDAECQEKLFEYLSGKGKSSVEPQLETMEFVNRLLSTRSQVQQNVLRARYGFWDGHCKTLQYVGNEMGLTKERIRQIQNVALAQIRGFIGPAPIWDFVTAKIAAYLEQKGASTRGIVREDEGPAALAHGCSVGQASLAMAFFQDLFPTGVSVLAQCLLEVEEGVFCIGEPSPPQRIEENDC